MVRYCSKCKKKIANDNKSGLCRKHYLQSKHYFCPKCGKRLRNKHIKMCRKCYDIQRRFKIKKCKQCGRLCRTHENKFCSYQCYDKYRQENRKIKVTEKTKKKDKNIELFKQKIEEYKQKQNFNRETHRKCYNCGTIILRRRGHIRCYSCVIKNNQRRFS